MSRNRIAGLILIGLALSPIIAGLVYVAGADNAAVIVFASVVLTWMLVTGIKLSLR